MRRSPCLSGIARELAKQVLVLAAGEVRYLCDFLATEVFGLG